MAVSPLRTVPGGPTLDRQPPHSLDAEQAALGSALISRNAAGVVLDQLQRDDFYLEPHRKIWDAMRALADAGAPVDTMSVPEEMRRAERLESVGGVPYIHALTEAVPTAAHVEYYCRLVMEKAVRRRMIEAGQAAIDRARDDEQPVEGLLTQAEEDVHQVRGRVRSGKRELISGRDLSAKELPPIRYFVDRYIPQGAALLYAPPKEGKTRFAFGLALAAAAGGSFLGQFPMEKTNVIAILLEDTEQTAQDTQREFLPDSEPAPENLKFAFEWSLWDEGGERELEEALRENPGTGLVIIDTLELIRPERATNGNPYREDVKHVSRMKKFADRHGILLLIIHHARKPPPGLIDSITGGALGTGGITGSFDTLFRIRTKAGDDSGEAIWEGHGRKVRPFSILMKQDGRFGWQYIGDAKKLTASTEEADVLDIVRQYPNGVKARELADQIDGLTANTAKQRLHRMAKRGALLNRGGWFSVNPFHQEGVTGVTGVTALTGETANSGVTVTAPEQNGRSYSVTATPGTMVTPGTPVTGVTPVTPFVDDPPAGAAGRVLYLARAKAWPPLDVANSAESFRLDKESDYQYVCEKWAEGDLETVEGQLRRVGG